jgi:hypothetical protein
MNDSAAFAIQPVSVQDITAFWIKSLIWPFIAPYVWFDALTKAVNLHRGDRASLYAGDRNLDRYIAACKAQID